MSRIDSFNFDEFSPWNPQEFASYAGNSVPQTACASNRKSQRQSKLPNPSKIVDSSKKALNLLEFELFEDKNASFFPKKHQTISCAKNRSLQTPKIQDSTVSRPESIKSQITVDYSTAKSQETYSDKNLNLDEPLHEQRKKTLALNPVSRESATHRSDKPEPMPLSAKKTIQELHFRNLKGQTPRNTQESRPKPPLKKALMTIALNTISLEENTGFSHRQQRPTMRLESKVSLVKTEVSALREFQGGRSRRHSQVELSFNEQNKTPKPASLSQIDGNEEFSCNQDKQPRRNSLQPFSEITSQNNHFLQGVNAQQMVYRGGMPSFPQNMKKSIQFDSEKSFALETRRTARIMDNPLEISAEQQSGKNSIERKNKRANCYDSTRLQLPALFDKMEKMQRQLRIFYRKNSQVGEKENRKGIC